MFVKLQTCYYLHTQKATLTLYTKFCQNLTDLKQSVVSTVAPQQEGPEFSNVCTGSLQVLLVQTHASIWVSFIGHSNLALGVSVNVKHLCVNPATVWPPVQSVPYGPRVTPELDNWKKWMDF